MQRSLIIRSLWPSKLKQFQFYQKGSELQALPFLLTNGGTA